jgi:LysM repeat protein
MKKATRHSLKLALLTALVGIFFTNKTALALKYRPKPEETLSHVALIHYGDPKKFIYISAANGIRDPDKFPRGKKLWVPTVWRYRIKKGDHLSRISAKYLKDKKRSGFLMWLNRIRDPKEVKVGSLITMPFLLNHRVKPGESMVDVARRYYFQTKPAGLLRKFNGKRTNALKPGERILVPIYDPDATYEKVKERLKRYQERVAKTTSERPKRPPKPEKVIRPKEVAVKTKEPTEDKAAEKPNGGSEAAPPEEFRVTPPEDAALVQKAFKLYRDGEYVLARSNLSKVLDLDRLSEADEAEAREILAFCLVAMDRPKEAEHEFVRLLMVAPDRTLDPVTTSPKILEVFKRAQGIK